MEKGKNKPCFSARQARETHPCLQDALQRGLSAQRPKLGDPTGRDVVVKKAASDREWSKETKRKISQRTRYSLEGDSEDDEGEEDSPSTVSALAKEPKRCTNLPR
jgi:hypothetical protein